MRISATRPLLRHSEVTWVCENADRKRESASPVRTLKMTVSSFLSDKRAHQLLEYEMYFEINRIARTVEEVQAIRTALEGKGRRHFRSWLLRHLNVRLEGRVYVNFEREQRAERQVEQTYASVRRFVMRRVNKRWEAEELQSGRMRFEKR